MTELRSNKAFMKLFLGRIVTNAGDSLYFIAAMWLVHDLTGSTFYTGLAGFLIQGPSAFGFLVGPLVDRWRLYRVLVGTQVVQGVAVLAVPLAATMDALSVWLVLAIMPVLTLVNQFLYAAQSAALPQLVDDDQLVRANSLFSMANQGLDMFFNGISGVLIVLFGAVSLYLVDSVTFFVALVLFLGVSVPVRWDEDDEDERYLTKLTEGIDYIRGSALRDMLIGSLVVNFVFGTGIAVFPAFADQIGGPEAFGFLMAAFAAGNVLGALGANYVDSYPFGLFSVASNLIAAAFLAAAVLIADLPFTLLLLFVGFVPLGMGVVMSSSLRQSAVDERLLGRVSAVSQSVGSAMIPIGSLLGGVLGKTFGVQTVLVMVSVAIGLYGVYFLVNPKLRSLPSVDEADEAALGL